MRIEEFKMEREDLVSVGQVVKIIEGVLPSSYYYTIEPAVAMSGNFPYNNRIKSCEGIVKDIIHNERGFYIQVEFNE